MVSINGSLFIVSDMHDIRTISELHKIFKALFRDHNSTILDLAEIIDVDLTLIQLIESARISAEKEGKSIKLSSPASGALLSALERGGFLSEPADPRTQFWLAA